MRLTVLSVAYPFAPVGLDAVGGAEQVLAQLDAALTRSGHSSIVIASRESKVKGVLACPTQSVNTIDTHTRRNTYRQYQLILADCLKKWPVDIVHMHGVDFHEYLPEADVPVLATLHLPPSWYPPGNFHLKRPRTYLNCVSASQRSACPRYDMLLPNIENGIAIEEFLGSHAKRTFTLSLGRICHEKGFHLALQAAHRAQVPFLLGGNVFPYAAHEKYFAGEIMPRLDSRRRFLGPVAFRRKRRLLSGARCLLAPSLVPETSSLVAMESLACGTPVIAFRAGALADIVEDGKTGFLVANVEEMADAIHSAASLNPETCRTSARERFSAEVTVRKYFAIYEQLARGSSIARSYAHAGNESGLCGLNNNAVHKFSISAPSLS